MLLQNKQLLPAEFGSNLPDKVLDIKQVNLGPALRSPRLIAHKSIE